jgi:single-strand DNA-binding protein
MPALNKVQLIGYLGKDPESRTTPTGKMVSSFSVAVTKRWKAGKETKEATDWFNVDVWGRQADLSQKFLKKGSLVYVEGRLQTDRYEDKSGETKYFTKVVASSVGFLDRKPAEEPVEEMSVAEEQGEYEA